MSRAAPFFDDKQYLRTVVAEKPPAESAAQAEGAARLAGTRFRVRVRAGAPVGRAETLTTDKDEEPPCTAGSLLLRGARRYCCRTAIALRVP